MDQFDIGDHSVGDFSVNPMPELSEASQECSLIAELRQRNAEMERTITKQRSEIEALRETIDGLNATRNPSSSLFNEDQLKAMESVNGAIGRKWCPKTILDSLQLLFNVGSRGYEFLRKNKRQPWPCKTTFRQRIRNFKIKEGVFHDVFPFLKLSVDKMNSFQKHCGLAFDEMAIIRVHWLK